MTRNTLAIGVTFDTLTCCYRSCGLTFAVPERWREARQADHTDFYCPNGHVQGYYGPSKQESQIKELTADLEFTRRARDEERDRRINAENAAMDLANSNRALRCVATKLRKRAAGGVCAFCSRTFQNVARHVASKHPGEPHDD